MSLAGYVALLELVDTNSSQSVLNHQHGDQRDRRCFTHAVRGSINVGVCVLVQYDPLDRRTSEGTLARLAADQSYHAMSSAMLFVSKTLPKLGVHLV